MSENITQLQKNLEKIASERAPQQARRFA